MAERVPDAKAKTPLDTRGDKKAEEIMKRLPDNFAQAEGELLADTSRYVKADTQVEMLQEDLAEA